MLPSGGPSHFPNLPTELLLMIVSDLPALPLCNLSATCRTLRARLGDIYTSHFAAGALGAVFRLDPQHNLHTPGCRQCEDNYQCALAILNQAVERGCTAVVEVLAEMQGMPIDAMCVGRLSLTRAVGRGHVDTVKCLLREGARMPGMGWWKVRLGARAAEMAALLAKHPVRGRNWGG